MPRAIWSGSISFGLVNVPVKLYSAVHPQGLSFHQFQEGTNARVRNKRVSEKTGKEVDYDDIVKGYEVEKGHYVMVEPDELAEFNPRATRTIDIEDFVDLEDIDRPSTTTTPTSSRLRTAREPGRRTPSS